MIRCGLNKREIDDSDATHGQVLLFIFMRQGGFDGVRGFANIFVRFHQTLQRGNDEIIEDSHRDFDAFIAGILHVLDVRRGGNMIGSWQKIRQDVDGAQDYFSNFFKSAAERILSSPLIFKSSIENEPPTSTLPLNTVDPDTTTFP